MDAVFSFKGKHWFLSNFYPSPFLNNRTKWPTVEHYFQAMKTTTQPDFLRIRNALLPGEAKGLGRKVVIRDDWEFVKTSIMLDAVRMKFDQNPKLVDLLVDTRAGTLVEGNTWHDNFWGVCTCPRCTKVHGHNYLGRILMLVREELRP